MGDRFQTIIDTQASLEEAPHLAQHVVQYLAGKGVVAPGLSDQGGYPRGPNALVISERLPHPEDRPVVHEPIPPVYFHLQVVVGRMTHSKDLNDFCPTRAGCPKCGKGLADLDSDWTPAAQAWLAGDPEAALDCPSCGTSTFVSRWIYDSGYGFGNLAFRFWNWPPFRSDFLKEIERELGHPIALVEGKF